MKTKLWVAILLPAVLMAGCVRTVNDRKAAAIPLGKDKVEGRYERSPQEVYNAAIEVVGSRGTIHNETIIRDEDATIQTIEGRIDNRRVWVRVEQVDPIVTAVTVQVRTSAGGTDQPLTYELEKLIALQLVQ